MFRLFIDFLVYMLTIYFSLFKKKLSIPLHLREEFFSMFSKINVPFGVGISIKLRKLFIVFISMFEDGDGSYLLTLEHSEWSPFHPSMRSRRLSPLLAFHYDNRLLGIRKTCKSCVWFCVFFSQCRLHVRIRIRYLPVQLHLLLF